MFQTFRTKFCRYFSSTNIHCKTMFSQTLPVPVPVRLGGLTTSLQKTYCGLTGSANLKLIVHTLRMFAMEWICSYEKRIYDGLEQENPWQGSGNTWGPRGAPTQTSYPVAGKLDRWVLYGSVINVKDAVRVYSRTLMGFWTSTSQLKLSYSWRVLRIRSWKKGTLMV
jgi:hypothetical protein